MTARSFTFGLVGALCLVGGCASYTPGTVPADARPLQAAALQNLLDRTARSDQWFNDGYDGGLRYRFEPGGRLEVRSRYVTSKVISGRWRVQADPARLCTQLEGSEEGCHAAYQLPGDRLYLDVPRLSAQANTFVITPR